MNADRIECACCGKKIPDDHCISRLRLTPEDMQGQQHPEDRKPGLRGHCCQGCKNVYLPIIAKRVGIAVEDMTAHDTY